VTEYEVGVKECGVEAEVCQVEREVEVRDCEKEVAEETAHEMELTVNGYEMAAVLVWEETEYAFHLVHLVPEHDVCILLDLRYVNYQMLRSTDADLLKLALPYSIADFSTSP
jgi:hypothetical protein